MKKNYLILLMMVIFVSANAQVGINTNTPSATLHVQKRTPLNLPDGIIPPRISGDSLRLKEAAYGTAQNGAIVYVTSPATTTGPKTTGVINRGMYVYDSNAINSSGTGTWAPIAQGPGDGAYSSRLSGNLSLLSLSLQLLGSSVHYLRLPLTTASPNTVDVASSQVTTITTDSYYTVPSTGIYQIDYSFISGQGVNLQLLSSARPGAIITRTPSGSTTTQLLDYKLYGGVSIVLVADISITQGQINHLYQLTAGDRIRFGIVDGGLNLNLLGNNSSASVSIFKVR